MNQYTARTLCPNCGAVNFATFKFWSPDDGDDETCEIDCKCGTYYEVECTVEIDIDYNVGEPKNILIPTQAELDDNPDFKYVSQDPNQISIEL